MPWWEQGRGLHDPEIQDDPARKADAEAAWALVVTLWKHPTLPGDYDRTFVGAADRLDAALEGLPEDAPLFGLHYPPTANPRGLISFTRDAAELLRRPQRGTALTSGPVGRVRTAEDARRLAAVCQPVAERASWLRDYIAYRYGIRFDRYPPHRVPLLDSEPTRTPLDWELAWQPPGPITVDPGVYDWQTEFLTLSLEEKRLWSG